MNNLFIKPSNNNIVKLKYFACTVLVLLLCFLHSPTAEAKRYSFDIDAQREVYLTRSAKPGFKMVKVIVYGRSVDKAIEKAMMDAVVALTFYGASGEGEMGNTPAILLEGRKAYDHKTKYFDKFFKKGAFMPFVKRVNRDYPTGKDNVKTSRGRRIQILLLVNWNGLAKTYKDAGLKTIVSGLSDY